ncbi:adenylate/guanylate cyclase domain-containing protein [bacterium SCSIO 12741]|nr:adenylate/guanylate cyclase domain-containing protein [bacterium SCSIO 12741]
MKEEYQRIIRDYMLGWFFAGLLWELLRYGSYGRDEFGLLYSIDGMGIFFLLWFCQSMIYGGFHILFEQNLAGRIRFHKMILVFLTVQMIVGVFSMTSVYYVAQLFNIPGVPTSIHEFYSMRIVPVALVYASIVNAFVGISIVTNRMLGRGNLLKLLQGKFYKPQVDERIIMFIDMKSSTKLAEQLGHEKYSLLIQECFHDLAVVYDHHSEVYQYIGDGVILFWDTKLKNSSAESCRALFKFLDTIDARSGFYRREFGVVPQFKAGIHVGDVTIAEVGTLKRELAYHGDTINTASRIQDQTGELGRHVLISEAFYQRIETYQEFAVKPVGKIHLKGKENDVNLYEIDRLGSNGH